MARRAYALIRAKGRSSANKVRRYNQRDRTRQENVAMPYTYDEAAERVVDYALEQRPPQDGDAVQSE